MKFSIVIPTLNNLDYLELCIKSIRKNSSYDHEIIVHNNGDKEPSKTFLDDQKVIYCILVLRPLKTHLQRS